MILQYEFFQMENYIRIRKIIAMQKARSIICHFFVPLYKQMACNAIMKIIAIVNVTGKSERRDFFFFSSTRVKMCTGARRGRFTYLCVRDFSSDRCVIDFRMYVRMFTCMPRNEANEMEWNEWKIVYDVV